MNTLTYGSLFSGIGGIDLGLDRAGFECQWQVEIDPYAQKVLAKHWPNVARYGDIRDCGGYTDNWQEDAPFWLSELRARYPDIYRPRKHNLAPVDLIAGGFPCQDISVAGPGTGIEGKRSGLWKEFHRVICELRPRFVLVENVAALAHRGIDTVLADLASCGYDAEWQVLPAAAFGAPHIRERIFIVAYLPGIRSYTWRSESARQQRPPFTYSNSAQVANATSQQRNGSGLAWHWWNELANSSTTLANANRERLAFRKVFTGNAQQELTTFARDCSTGAGQWATEPSICRVVDGVSHRVDRLRGLGNAVVQQVAEYVGRCIMHAVEMESAGVA